MMGIAPQPAATATISLRPATHDDVDAIMACERQPGYDDTVGRWSREEHLAALAEPSHRYIVALDSHNAVIGFVILQEIAPAASAVLVRRIAALSQGRGHGRALLDHALALIFDELGAAKAWLRVWPHNARGMALYTKLGMREDGLSEVQRNGAPAVMTIMSIDAARYRDRKPRSETP